MKIKPGLVVFDRGGKVNHGSDTIVIVAHKGPGGNDPYWTCYEFTPWSTGVVPMWNAVRASHVHQFTNDEIEAMEPIGSIADFIKNIAPTTDGGEIK